MRYSLNNYINALVGALQETPNEKKDIILTNFVKLIEKNGDISKRDKIIEAVHRKFVNMSGGKWVSVELARKASEPRMRLIKEMFTAKDHVIFYINPELKAGIRITINGEEELDNSLNNKLKKLFK
jgi:F0F1-type ATP synthase delta subunit